MKVIPPFRDPDCLESTPESSPEKSAEGGYQPPISHLDTKKTTKDKCIAAAGLGPSFIGEIKEVSLGTEISTKRSLDVTTTSSSSNSTLATSSTTTSSSTATKFTTANFTEAKVTPVVQNSVLLNVGCASLSSSPTPVHSRDNSSSATDGTEAAATEVTSASTLTEDASSQRHKSVDGSSDESHASSKKSKKKKKRKSDSRHHHHHRDRETASCSGAARPSDDEEEYEVQVEHVEKVKAKGSKSAPNLPSMEAGKISQRELLSKLKPTSVVLNQISSNRQPAATSSSTSSTTATFSTTKPVFTVVQRPSGSFSCTQLRSLSPASPPPPEIGEYLSAPPRSSVLLCNSGVSVASASSSVTSLSR